MSILVDETTRLVVQGITGREGAFHATRNKAYGTNVVAGVTPGKAGQDVEGIPVFNTVRDAVEATDANTAISFFGRCSACHNTIRALVATVAGTSPLFNSAVSSVRSSIVNSTPQVNNIAGSTNVK